MFAEPTPSHAAPVSRLAVVIMRRPLLVVLAVLLLHPVLLHAAPQVAAQNPIPSIEMECTPESIELASIPGTPGQGTHACTATNPSIHPIVINMSVTELDELLITVPDTLTVAAGEDEVFAIGVRTIGAPDVGTYDYTLDYVISTVQGIPYIIGQNQTVDLSADVLAFRDLSIDLDPSSGDLPWEGTWTTDVTVTNEGNGGDTVRFSVDLITNTLGGEDTDLLVDATFDSEEVTLAAGASRTVTLEVERTSTGRSIAGSLQFDVTATSTATGATVDASRRASVQVKAGSSSTGGGPDDSDDVTTSAFDLEELAENPLALGGIGAVALAIIILAIVVLRPSKSKRAAAAPRSSARTSRSGRGGGRSRATAASASSGSGERRRRRSDAAGAAAGAAAEAATTASTTTARTRRSTATAGGGGGDSDREARAAARRARREAAATGAGGGEPVAAGAVAPGRDLSRRRTRSSGGTGERRRR